MKILLTIVAIITWVMALISGVFTVYTIYIACEISENRGEHIECQEHLERAHIQLEECRSSLHPNRSAEEFCELYYKVSDIDKVKNR